MFDKRGKTSEPERFKSFEELLDSGLCLTVKDLAPGTKFVKFNKVMGIQARGEVTGRPFKESTRHGIDSKVPVSITSGWRPDDGSLYSGDLGVAPYSNGYWNPENRIVRPEHEHLLPEPEMSGFKQA